MNKGCYINNDAILHNMATPFHIEALDDNFANLGFNRGLIFPLLNLKYAENEAGKLGHDIGIVSQLNCADQFALQGEALYSETGLEVEYDNFTFNSEANLRLNYSDVPLLLIFKTKEDFNLQECPDGNQFIGHFGYMGGLQKIEGDHEINGII